MKPFVKAFIDYHDILWLPEKIQDVSKFLEVELGDVHYAEVAYTKEIFGYWGVFWEEGRCPSIDEVKQMLYDKGVDDEDIYDLSNTDLLV